MPLSSRQQLVLLASLTVVGLTPTLASANECLVSTVGRGEVSGISVADPLIEVFGNESVDVALELRLGLRQVPARSDSLGSDESGVLWCLSPDDPRCFPVDGPTEAPSLSDPMPSSAAPSMPSPEPSDARDQELSTNSHAGPSGERARVERPPRG